MRIVHVSDCFLPRLGGIESQVSRLATKQAEAGHQVTVLTCDADESEPQISGLGVQVVRSVWPNPFRTPIDPRAPKRFHQLIDKLAPDVVHLHMGEFTPVVQVLLLHLAKTVHPVVVSVHSVWSKFPTIPLFKEVAKLYDLQQAPIGWTGVSQLVGNMIRRVIPDQFVRVLPNGIETSDWMLPASARVLSNGSSLHVVSATRFAPRKRVFQLLRIIQQAAAISGPMRVTLAGDGPLLKQVRARAPYWIEFPGRLSQEQLAKLYASADVFVAPGVKDSFSIAGVEARAAGLALLTRSQSGLGQDLRDRVEGRRAETDREMARILAEWNLHPVQVENIKANNRESGRAGAQRFDWSVVLPETLSTYQWAKALRESGL